MFHEKSFASLFGVLIGLLIAFAANGNKIEVKDNSALKEATLVEIAGTIQTNRQAHRNFQPMSYDEKHWQPPPAPNNLRSVDIANRKRELQELLFPPLANRSRHMHDYGKYKRSLYGEFIPDADHNCPNADDQKNNVSTITVPCVKCSDLEVCYILNGLTVQEVYYPNNVDLKGTCTIIEDLGSRMSLEIFGVGRTFRDTPECRDIVMQYLCLFWGSDNVMYTNCCIHSEYVTGTDKANQIMSPRYPCQSFCVQVAQVCANDDTYIQLCHEILCPPEDTSCTPDPEVESIVLNAEIGCEFPLVVNPYAPRNAASRVQPIAGQVASLALFALSLLWLL